MKMTFFQYESQYKAKNHQTRLYSLVLQGCTHWWNWPRRHPPNLLFGLMVLSKVDSMAKRNLSNTSKSWNQLCIRNSAVDQLTLHNLIRQTKPVRSFQIPGLLYLTRHILLASGVEDVLTEETFKITNRSSLFEHSILLHDCHQASGVNLVWIMTSTCWICWMTLSVSGVGSQSALDEGTYSPGPTCFGPTI